MPISLPSVSVKQFSNEFSRTFQASRELTGTTLEIHGVVSDSFQWPKMRSEGMLPRLRRRLIHIWDKVVYKIYK